MISDYLNNWELWPFKYGFRFALTKAGSVGDTILGAAMSLQGDADFVWKALSIDVDGSNGAAVGDVNEFSGTAPMATYDVDANQYIQYTRKMYLPDSRAIQTTHQLQEPLSSGSALGPLKGMLGGASFIDAFSGINYANDGDATRPLPVIPEVLLGKSSALTIDLQNLTAATEFASDFPIMLEVCFHGFKLFRKGTHFSLDRNKRYAALPFSYYAPIPALSPSAAGQIAPLNVLNLDAGSDFLLLSVDTTGWNGSGAPAAGYNAGPGNGFQFQYYGPEGEQTSFSNSTVRHGLLSRGNALGTSRFPGVVCPPMQYPRAGRILWDYYLPANSVQPAASNGPLLVRFRGIKLYAV